MVATEIERKTHDIQSVRSTCFIQRKFSSFSLSLCVSFTLMQNEYDLVANTHTKRNRNGWILNV